MQFFIHKNCFELSLSVHFLFCEILNLIRRLPFAVYVMLKLSFVSIHKNAKTGTNFASIQPATFIGTTKLNLFQGHFHSDTLSYRRLLFGYHSVCQ